MNYRVARPAAENNAEVRIRVESEAERYRAGIAELATKPWMFRIAFGQTPDPSDALMEPLSLPPAPR